MQPAFGGISVQKSRAPPEVRPHQTLLPPPLEQQLDAGRRGNGGRAAEDGQVPSRAVLALKRRSCIDAGVSRVEEVEEPLDPELALAYADNPVRLGQIDSPIIQLVAGEYGVSGDAAPFVCLGGFRNTRSVYNLEGNIVGLGLVLELRRTPPASKMDRPVAVEGVKREVKILKAHRGHENIVNFYNAFEDDSYVYIVMEMFSGESKNSIKKSTF